MQLFGFRIKIDDDGHNYNDDERWTLYEQTDISFTDRNCFNVGTLAHSSETFSSSVSSITTDSIQGILEILIQSGENVRSAINKFNKTTPLQALVLESEQMIITLTQGILEVGEQQKTFAGEALKDMISIKYMLIASRNGLNGLALRTVLTVDNLKAISEAFFAANDADVAMTMADKMEYITEMMTDMTNLIQNTNKQIKEANEIYADVRKRMISIVAKLRGYKSAL